MDFQGYELAVQSFTHNCIYCGVEITGTLIDIAAHQGSHTGKEDETMKANKTLRDIDWLGDERPLVML